MNIHALLQRARDCDRLGQDESAKSAYLEYLKVKPDDLGALTDLGNLALRTGYRSAARTAYERVLQIDPNNCVALVNLGNVLLDASELAAARSHYEAALGVDPDFAPAHQGLSYVYARLGDEVASRKHRLLGFRGNAYTRIPYRGAGIPMRAVVLVSAAGGNFNTDWLLHDHNVDVFKVAAEYADPDQPLPAHEVLVNAIGDADLSHEALTAAIRMCARSNAKIINAPEQVLKTARIANADRLQALPDVVTPRCACFPASVWRRRTICRARSVLAIRFCCGHLAITPVVTFSNWRARKTFRTRSHRFPGTTCSRSSTSTFANATDVYASTA